jgi:hypothetical protein
MISRKVHISELTSEANLELALKLARYLKTRIKDTHARPEWTERNFKLLSNFARGVGAVSHYSKSESRERREWLWDFVAYLDGQGPLLVAESEWAPKNAEIEKDFRKLILARSPLKLMMARLHKMKDAVSRAEEIADLLTKCVHSSCMNFLPGEVFILYIVYWDDKRGNNQDFVYTLQAPGRLKYLSAKNRKFMPVS